MSLTAFLLARIAEDEAVARQAIQAARPGVIWIWINVETDEPARLDGELENVSLRTREEFPTTSGVGPLPAFIVDNAESYAERAGALRHIARWDPARVLAECEAKRRIVEIHAGTESALSFLSTVRDGDPIAIGLVQATMATTTAVVKLLALPGGPTP